MTSTIQQDSTQQSTTGTWKRGRAAHQTAPSSYEDFYRQYYGYTVSLVGKLGIEQASAEDVAQAILIRFYERDSLSYYNPAATFHAPGQTASFRTFLTGFVRTYVQHHRTQQTKLHSRETLLTLNGSTSDDEGTVNWFEEKSEPVYLDTASVEAESTIRDIRAHLVAAQERIEAGKVSAKTGRRSKAATSINLPVLFDTIQAEVTATGAASPTAVKRALGLSDSTYYDHLKVLRAEVRAWEESVA